MHDELVTTYSADIDQWTVGHQFLKDNVKCPNGSFPIPTKGWQIGNPIETM